jgi:hypothetical protein
MSDMWGGAAKVYTGSRHMYEAVQRQCPELFPRILDAFHLAAAIGISAIDIPEQHGRKPFQRETPEILNMYSVDPDEVLGPLLVALFPDTSGNERYNMLMEFAEYGIERIYQEVRDTATFDPSPYLIDTP